MTSHIQIMAALNSFPYYTNVYRDANHSNFCGIIPFFKADFRNTILDVKFRNMMILQAKVVPDKIKDVTPTYTPVLRTFYVAIDKYT